MVTVWNKQTSDDTSLQISWTREHFTLRLILQVWRYGYQKPCIFIFQLLLGQINKNHEQKLTLSLMTLKH